MTPARKRQLYEYVAIILISALISFGVAQFTNPSSSKSGSSSSTPNTLAAVLKSGVLYAAAPCDEGLPYAGRNTAGQCIGFLPDVWAQLAKSLGVKLQIVDTPDASRIPFMEAGKIDVAQGTITLPRDQAVSFSNPINVDGTTVAVLKSSGITTVAQLAGKTVSVISGGSGEVFAARYLPKANLDHVDGSAVALQALKAGETVADVDNYTYLVAAEKQDSSLTNLPTVFNEPAGLMAPLGDMEWVQYLNHFLDDMWSSGESTCGCMSQIYEKWFNAPPLKVQYSY